MPTPKPDHERPFLIKHQPRKGPILKPRIHLVSSYDSGYYETACGLNFNQSTVDDPYFDTHPYPVTVSISGVDVCDNCKRGDEWNRIRENQ